MRKRHFVGILRLALVLTALLFWGASHGRAQSVQHQHSPQHEEKTITDGAGRVHVRRQHITYAQRRAAAKQRVKALRKAAMQKRMAEVKK